MGSAPAYTPDRIRNLVVLGHGGTGKTTLIDSCCHESGSTKRRGSVSEGTALTMFTPEELAHGLSMNCSVAYATWGDYKINFIDTPGYLDFLGEACAGVHVADGAMLVLSAAGGVEIGAERFWQMLEEQAHPALLCLTMLDRPNVDFEAVCKQIREELTAKLLPLEIPIGTGEMLQGIVDLLSDTVRPVRFAPADPKEYRAEISAEDRARIDRARAELIEAIAATDDLLLERYFEGEPIAAHEMRAALKRAVLRRELVPLLCGLPSGFSSMQTVLDAVVELMPSPVEAATVRGEEVGSPAAVPSSSLDQPFCGLVFKTTNEPHVGELSYIRIRSGSVASGQEVFNHTRQRGQKLSHLSIPLGKERHEVACLGAGDIAVVAKLRGTQTNDTLAGVGEIRTLPPIAFPEPDIAVALEVEVRGEEDKLSQALALAQQEDPCFRAEYDAETGQTIVRACGDLHLEVQLERIRRKYNVTAIARVPRISYRETVRARGEAHGRHRKQSGGRGQFGDCHIRIRPLPRGEGYRFRDAIVGGVIPGKFIPAVDKGIQEAAQRGVLAGYPMVDFEVECFDGSYHAVDSSEVAFKIAGSLAFQRAAAAADPVLLEPILEVEVVTPELFLGEVMGDLNQRRGRILGLEARGARQVVRALVPESEMYRYATTLRSLTQGRATHTHRFSSFEEVPATEVARITEARNESTPIDAVVR